MQLDLSSNFIQDEGAKFLSQTLVTLKQLHLLDISGNMITESGLEYLCNALGRSANPLEIRKMVLSFNPIRSSSLKLVSNLCQKKNVISLALTSCDLTDVGEMEQLTTVKSINLSYNHLTADGFKAFLRKLNPGITEELNFERCSSELELGESIVHFISSGCYATLSDLNLAALNLNENEILDILRTVEKCEQLKTLNLSNQKQLTFISFRFILFSMDCQSLERVNLIGCINLHDTKHFLNLQNIDTHSRNCLQNVQLSLPQTDELKSNFIDRVRDLWDVASGYRGRLEQDKNILHLMYEDDKEKPYRL